MKRYHLRKSSWAVLLLLMSCSSVKDDKSKDTSLDKAYSASFVLDSGWDIYDGGGYRYGPSIMLDGATIHAWFAAPGGVHGQDQLHYHTTDKELPVSIKASDKAGQKFTSSVDFYGLAVRCPNWNSTSSSLTLNLYAWKGSYESSIASNPLASKRFENYKDNAILQVNKEGGFKAGSYVWVITNTVGTAGVWARQGRADAVEAYFNGAAQSYSFESFLLNKPSNSVVYWDQVAYKKSTDAGKTWTEEKMVLKPTEGTRDEFSICDPGVIKIGDYYYLGYTSTEDERMIFNHAYVARANSPEGPWQKWDGQGWSNSPQPVVEFDGDKDAWGAGEPSMVVKNDSLFFYYTWRDTGLQEIRVAVADAKDPNWPKNLQYKGVAVSQTNLKGADSGDVKFRKDRQKFQLLHTASRLSKDSYLMLWESEDGLTFKKVADIKDKAEQFLHNCGWSSDALGHIDPAVQQYVGYGYGPDWGNWKTKWHPIKFELLK